MIYTQLIGGLGNMMFQIATMESLAKDYGLEVNYLEVNSHLQGMKQFKRTSTYNPLEYLNIFKNFNWPSKINYCANETIQVPFCYIDLFPKDNDCYWGYFQSEKYFKHNREHILNLFEPTNEVMGQVNKYFPLLKNKITCAIHVRRGDYLKNSNVHYVQDMEYFSNAAIEIGEVDRYIIFSDDMTWCKKMFLNDRYFFNKNIIFIEGEKDYVELFLMSKCTHHIISNSSFSWWGAWLNKNENKKVVAPKKWWSGYGDDIVPENWIKI